MTKIDALYEIVHLHQGTGNTTWIFEQAKRNPKVRILFANNPLAAEKEKEYVEWFTKINKRKPNKKEIPHFCGFGDVMIHTTHGLRIPLVIDHSCFQQKDIQELFESGRQDALSEAGEISTQNLLVAHEVINKLSEKWYIKWFPWRRKALKKDVLALLK